MTGVEQIFHVPLTVCWERKLLYISKPMSSRNRETAFFRWPVQYVLTAQKGSWRGSAYKNRSARDLFYPSKYFSFSETASGVQSWKV